MEDNYGNTIKDGDILNYADHNGYASGYVVADESYRGGFRINGRSIENILDDCYDVRTFRPMGKKS